MGGGCKVGAVSQARNPALWLQRMDDDAVAEVAVDAARKRVGFIARNGKQRTVQQQQPVALEAQVHGVCADPCIGAG